VLKKEKKRKKKRKKKTTIILTYFQTNIDNVRIIMKTNVDIDSFDDEELKARLSMFDGEVNVRIVSSVR
jgi:ADP-dependent phosphofructokinase/glucokinase